MNWIKKKLHSNSGASMILSLALMLICVMVSSVIVAAAAAGSARNANRTSQQQAYLAMSSAVELIMEELPEAADKFEMIAVTKDYKCNDAETFSAQIIKNGSTKEYVAKLDEGACSDISTPTPTSSTTIDSLLKELIEKACKSIYNGSLSYSKTFIISVNDAEGRIPEVICDFTMNTEYDMTFELYFALGSSYSAAGATITMAGECNVQSMPGENLDCDHDIIYYQTGRWGGWKDYNNYPFRGTQTTRTTTIKWNPPTYTKGVAAH